MTIQAPNADGRDDGHDPLTRVAVLRSLNDNLEGELWEAVLAARAAGYSLRRVARAAGLSPTHLARRLAEEQQ